MRLAAFQLGECCLDKGVLLTPGVDEGKHVHIPVPGYLIETDAGERILIDTGLHPEHVDDPGASLAHLPKLAALLLPFMRDEDRLERRLGQLGLAVSDVTHVINTHLHFDHCGNNELLPGVPIYVQREHYEFALGDRDYFRRYFDLPGLEYVLLDGEVELFPGVRVLLGPGHVPALQAVLVELPRTGKVLLAGDVIDCEENLARDVWAAVDPEAARASAARLVRIAEEEGAMLVYGHDAAQWRTLRLAPQWYE